MEKLSQEEIQLLNTDFGEEIEKHAAARATAINDAYQYGFDKKASELANDMDKLAAEAEEAKKKEIEDEDEDEEMDEESEKAAAELGAFIERGFFDGLRKEGAERHGNEMHYLQPYIEEKIAVSAALKARTYLERASRAGKGVADKVRKGAKNVKEYHQKAYQQAKGGYNARRLGKGMQEKAQAVGKDTASGKALQSTGDSLVNTGTKSMLRNTGKLVGSGAAATGIVGGTGYGAYKAMGGGKKD